MDEFFKDTKKGDCLIESSDEDEDYTDIEDCEIDNVNYAKNKDGYIYPREGGEPIGKYDFSKKKWIEKYI